MMVDGFGNKYYYMSFTIYQNNEKQIEIITRPKMGSSTLQHPGIVYDKKPGDRVVRLRNPNEGRHGLFGPKRGLKDHGRGVVGKGRSKIFKRLYVYISGHFKSPRSYGFVCFKEVWVI